MGYFSRKVDRGRSLVDMERVHEKAQEDDVHLLWEAIPDSPPQKPCFLRFSTAKKHEYSQRRTGIFAVAYRLKRSDDLDPDSRRSLEDALGWFEQNLPSPTVPSPG